MSFKFKFTVFTPCYNSEAFIHRVYESLINQSYRNFEWLVINDASTDNTHNILQNYIKSADFDIRYFNLPNNQMLTRNYNLAIKEAQGEFFLPAGHDDEFIPDAMKVFLTAWEKYGKDEYSGVSCLCVDQKNNIVGDKYPDSPFISNYFDILFNLKISGEKWGFIRTDVIKKYMLPENIDTYISEGLMWMGIGNDYQTIYINEALRIYYINQQDHVSLSKEYKIKYIKGRWYENFTIINNYSSKISSYSYLLKVYVNYIRFSFHLTHSLNEIIRKFSSNRIKVVVFILFPFGMALSFLDSIRNRVSSV